MRRDIEFSAEGTILHGWLYLPERPAGRVPSVVMAHGFTAVKEMSISGYQASLRRVPAQQVPGLLAAFVEDRERRFRGAPPVMRPVLPREPGGPAVFSGAARDWFLRHL